MMHTTVSGWPDAYSEPLVAAPSSVRSTTLRVVAPAGKSRGFQSVFRKPAVGPVAPAGLAPCWKSLIAYLLFYILVRFLTIQ